MSIDDEIDKIHFRTYNHIVDSILRNHPEMTKKDVKKIVDKRIHDHFVKLKKVKPYYVKIFSSIPNTWFMDLMDNGKDNSPRYYHLFIGTNNHYAVAYPLNSKSALAIRQTLTRFINEYHPVKLTSDEEAGFVEKNNVQLLTDNHCSLHIITEQNHSSLGIIDRMIRTLRDMNIPTMKDIRQSHSDKYKTFSEKRMNKLLDIYNNTYHSRINCTPNEMFNNPDMEKEYIFKQEDKREQQTRIPDMVLHKGDYVRYILPRANGTKKRFQYSWERYKVVEVNGNMYTIAAKDGTVKNLPRWKLMKAKNVDSIKWANTIPGKWNGVVKEILDYDNKQQKYHVLFSVPDGEDYEDYVPASYLRGNFPQLVSDMEKDFMQQTS